MKSLLFAVLLAGAVYGQTNLTILTYPVPYTELWVTNAIRTNTLESTGYLPYSRETMQSYDAEQIVKTLGESGEICKVYGHQWDAVPHITLEFRPDGDYPQHRKCRICGKQEKKMPEVWK